MDLPVEPPVKPMLAKASREIPEGDFLYEPKWDGFRALVFRDGDEVEITSRNTKPFTRYFPELLGPLREQLPQRCVLDGELVVPQPGGLDFDLLGQRIHPAESRIQRLAVEIPAHLVFFDILALDSTDLRSIELSQRRATMESVLGAATPPLHLTPATTDHALASEWFERFDGGGFDGVMAKPLTGTYDEDRRSQTKVKHHRTVDCVVAGYAEHRNGGVGSLKLGLYQTPSAAAEPRPGPPGDAGAPPSHHVTGAPPSHHVTGAPVLHHVGVASAFSAAQRRTLVGELEPLRLDGDEAHPWTGNANSEADGQDGVHAARVPGSPNRWSASRASAAWVPLRPERVVEVTCENVSNHRFRHPARFVRWRPDKDPTECLMDQLDTVTPPEFDELFPGASDL